MLSSAVTDGPPAQGPLRGLKKLRESRRPRRCRSKREIALLIEKSPKRSKALLLTDDLDALFARREDRHGTPAVVFAVATPWREERRLRVLPEARDAARCGHLLRAHDDARQPDGTAERSTTYAYGHPTRTALTFLEQFVGPPRATALEVQAGDRAAKFRPMTITKQIRATARKGTTVVEANLSGDSEFATPGRDSFLGHLQVASPGASAGAEWGPTRPSAVPPQVLAGGSAWRAGSPTPSAASPCRR